ncbi:cobalt transporter CbiM [Desulfosarcina ovata]|uniref:Cobalt transporter CbiM n=2 Tax=Desulfosarcina ovata TaxID=83564 RepID=A0A5K8AAV6_9BACT|nr:cobalt transporter CbiM [Desulfosarcina ovata]BBO82447.1 cobalt transporter CbiM [Desulfosarcina ovata subsp. sediminis]BBO89649.1 cobalt transporter CbiM [Desulfosarcina ovata subsp. ovata]
MHISEGVISAPVLIGSGVLTVAGTAIGLKKMDYEHVAQAGILSATFFLASLIHVPIGPSSVHLLLNGIVGLMLGWGAFAAILVGLALQAMLFQFGGITVLGVNTLNVAGPAVLCYYLFGRLVQKDTGLAVVGAFACGALSVLLTSLMVALSLLFTEESFFEVAALVVTAHLPVMIIEGIITAFCIGFLKKVKPDSLPGFSTSPGESTVQ